MIYNVQSYRKFNPSNENNKPKLQWHHLQDEILEAPERSSECLQDRSPGGTRAAGEACRQHMANLRFVIYFDIKSKYTGGSTTIRRWGRRTMLLMPRWCMIRRRVMA